MRVFAATDIGKHRMNNQDYVYATGDAIGPLPNLLIVADGMGGHKGGDFASRFVVEQICSIVKKSKQKQPVAILSNAIEKANKNLWIEAQGNPELWNMGTTLVVATVDNGKMYVANVGDSRLYLIRNNINQVTKDHSLVEEMVQKGELSRNDAREHHKKNIITRAVGIEQGVDIDFFEEDISSVDKALLCSDGLTNMLKDDEILKIVSQDKDLEIICNELIDRANEEGGEDNISVVMADNMTDVSLKNEL